MEANGVPKAEDGAEDPGPQAGRPAAAQSDSLAGVQTPGPTALWETVERKFLEYQQLAHRSPADRQESLLRLLPLFLKVSAVIFDAAPPHGALGYLWDDWKLS